jgi:hypothetical protein
MNLLKITQTVTHIFNCNSLTRFWIANIILRHQKSFIMYRNFLLFAGLMSLLLFSCHKNGPDNNNNTSNTDTTGNINDTINPPAHNWFKLKTIISNTKYLNSTLTKQDSTDITLDSVNKKITIKRYNVFSSYKDTTIETYAYNSNYQLTTYECTKNSSQLYISYMNFVRDANGQVTKVLSGYKNGLIALSEGAVKYDKRGDTTFITYLDSTRKDPQYYTGRDFYTVALLNGKLIANTDFPVKDKSTDTVLEKYEYDASGNLVTYTEKYGNTAPRITTYQRGSQAPQELQKFFAQWMGDLFWFSRAKYFFPLQKIGYYGCILGNAVQSMNVENVVVPYTNTFDANGNLTSLSRVGPYDGLGSPTVTEQYRYRH